MVSMGGGGASGPREGERGGRPSPPLLGVPLLMVLVVVLLLAGRGKEAG